MPLNQLDEYDYDLPAELIAQAPAAHRDASRLLVIDRASGRLQDAQFSDLPDLLQPGDLLVANESRVIPARLFGRLPSGGQIELLLIRSTSGDSWEVMTRPARKLKLGSIIDLPMDVTATIEAVLKEGRRIVRFQGTTDFDQWLESVGEPPIPPYVHGLPDDPERYQTVYSETRGSVAAPTAGLHFTPELLDRLRNSGVETRFVTLHVGPGSFQPLTEERLAGSRLEPEWGSISSETAGAIQSAKAEGRRVIAVGTTTTRLIEGAAARTGEVVAWSGEIDLFIKPPYQFRVIDGLITNFHLPRSSLLLLVSAFAGRSVIREAYGHAIRERYRFYSFGDATLIV